MIQISRCNAGEARQLLIGLKGQKTDVADIVDLRALVERGLPFKITQAGETVGAFVLAGFGSTLWITAAAGRASVDLTDEIDAYATISALAFDELAFRTERPGLVRKALALGWRIDRNTGPSFYMRKKIK